MPNKNEYDVVIVGGGVSGTALLYVLSTYTTVKRVALLEKYPTVGQVNSHHSNNSQTLHFGDIETNYPLEKAKKVKRAAELVKTYILTQDKDKKTYSKYHKMVLAVGEEECELLARRYEEFKTLFPSLKKIGREEIARIEPKVVEGRDPTEKLLALYTNDGYAVDFGRLAEFFVEHTKNLNQDSTIILNEKVKRIEKKGDAYILTTTHQKLTANVVAVTAGAHSLLFAKQLGYGSEYALLMVAGNFYFTPHVLDGKVYTMQIKKLPFAAVHGDPEVHDKTKTRFGPTAKTSFILERSNYATFIEYCISASFVKGFASFLTVLFDWTRFSYMFKNILYEVPYFGNQLFNKQVTKIIPTMKAVQLKKAKGYGGMRPQIVNIKTRQLQLGEAKIIGENIIFNMTPSPGASTCLKNAEVDAKKIVEFLGNNHAFDEKKFKNDFRR